MKKNFSKALAGTLTVAMVLGMAAPAAGTTAQAYAKNGIKTKYSAIYAGKTKTYTLKTAKKNTKWSVTGEGKQYVTLSAKKGKTVKATIAKDAPAGVKATVVAKLKKGKKYKKVDADKFTIKVDATAVAVEGNGEVKTGSTATYTAKTTPTKTTNHVYFTVTDKNGKATTGATMNATSGVLTANAAGEYKVNVATARGDVKAAAGQFTANASMDVKVTDPAIPDAKLTSAKQTEAKKIVVTFDSEVKELKTDEVTVVCDTDKSTKTVKAVTIAADKKSATIETLVDVLDAKTYTVTYKGSTASFTASDGTVVDFSLNNTQFQIKKPQELKVNALDKNQVIVKTVDVEDASVTDGNYSINVTSNDGYFKDKKLVMQTVGKTEDVTAVYFNGTYSSSGEMNGKVEKKFTITAVAQEPLASNYQYATISDEAPDDWTEITSNLKIAIGEKKKNKLFAKILDVKGIPTVDGVPNISDLEIDCRTSDDNILLVDASDDDVVLEGVKAGTAYVQVRQKNKVMLTIPVTVTAAKSLTNCVLKNPTQTISNSTRIDDSVTLELDTHKDQYNDDVSNDDIYVSSVELKKYPENTVNGTKVGKVWGENQMSAATGSDSHIGDFVFRTWTGDGTLEGLKVAPKGTYVYEFTLKDKNTDNTLRRTKTIVVKEPNFEKKPTVKIAGSSSENLKNEANKHVDFKLGLYYEGVLGAYVNLGNMVENTDIAKLSFNGVNDKDKVTNGSIEALRTISSDGAIGYLVKDSEAKGYIPAETEYTKFVFVATESTNKIYDRTAKADVSNAISDIGNGTFIDKVSVGNYAVKLDLAKEIGSIKVKNIVENEASKWYSYAVKKETAKTEVIDNKKELTKTVSIKDDQPKLVVTQVKNNIDAGSATEAVWKSCTFKYDGKTYYKADKDDSNKGVGIWCEREKADGVKTSEIDYYKNGKVYNIARLFVYVQQEAKKNKDRDNEPLVRFALKPNFSITCND